MAKTVHVMDYIPSALWPNIETFAYTDDVSSYINTALTDAAGTSGVGGEVIIDAGGFLASSLVVYPQQYVHGAWQSSVFKQIGSQSVFVTSEWANNIAKQSPGRLFRDLAFITDDPTAGGYCIVDLGFRDIMQEIQTTGLPLMLTSICSDGVTQVVNTGNHRMENFSFYRSPRGGILTNGACTDCLVQKCAFSYVGSSDGAAAIDIGGLAGWEFDLLRMFSCDGALFRAPSVWNTSITNSMLDWNGGGNAALDLQLELPKDEGIRIIGNNFRIHAPTPGRNYTFTDLHASTSPVLNLVHIGNTYWVDTSVSGNDVTACSLSAPDYAGSSRGNQYIGFAPDQIGNVEQLLGEQAAILTRSI